MAVNERRKAHQGTNSSHISTQKDSLVFLLIPSLPHFPLHFLPKHAQLWKRFFKVGQRERDRQRERNSCQPARQVEWGPEYHPSPPSLPTLGISLTLGVRWSLPGAWPSPPQVVSQSTWLQLGWNLALHGSSCSLPLDLITNRAPVVAISH